MNAVYYFSGSGHSQAVAAYFAMELRVPLVEISQTKEPVEAGMALLVFPVYCQNIPPVVKDFLRRFRAKDVVLIATYGKISYGNVLWEASRIVRGRVIAAAYVPMGHSYLDASKQFDPQPLQAIFQRIEAPQAAVVRRSKKNPFSNFFPAWRSRISSEIRPDGNCGGCNICAQECPMGAIRAGRIHGGCIRCLRCVCHCPKAALHFEPGPLLRSYLKRAIHEDTVVYL